MLFNSFNLNGISHSNELEQSISVLSCWMVFFHFYSNFNAPFCEQVVETVGLHCLLCIFPTKRVFKAYMG